MTAVVRVFFVLILAFYARAVVGVAMEPAGAVAEVTK